MVPTTESDPHSTQPGEVAELVARLRVGGTRALAMTFVDNGGVTRVRVVPLQRLESVLRSGVGMSVAWAVAGTDDSFAVVAPFDSPTGDLRVFPDLTALQPQDGSSPLAWAPLEQYSQEQEPFVCCQRTVLRTAVERWRERGIEFKAAFEVEFALLDDEGAPAHRGPGYSASAFLEIEPFALALMEALASHGIDVEQFHVEHGPGQLEFSCAPRDPLTAADQLVLGRLLTRRVAAQHGFRVSFAPVPFPEAVGNGCHLHLSGWRDGVNLMRADTPESAPTGDGAAMIAGILAALPDLLAVIAPSVPSYLRLQPHHWAGAYACWGIENREAAVRLVPGTRSSRSSSANVEIKTVDGAANPYLAVGALLGAALNGVERGASLPAPVQCDPDTMTPTERHDAGVTRFSETLSDAIERLAKSDVAVAALGPELHQAFLGVRRQEWATFRDHDVAALTAAYRWRY
ncbi:glutamine synthetase family protein [Pseudonocardia kujensis]|uniref:glutamine synthetase family protein n=1 Tax=Pseudonocardia kujensis TaxID=1128675 RepID=UPI001E34642B|nr:glutamine synthetase family protein [Pseudonocardia kujensis]MCE0768080.1 glutamine synthetase family protein [Pseudonocardia kujensis]